MGQDRRHGARARTRARRLALQGLYQWQMNAGSADEIIQQLYAGQNVRDTDTDYFEELLHQVIAENLSLETTFAPHLDRPLGQLDAIERAILLIGTYELRSRVDVPYRVVLDEAVELTRKFGAEGSHRYINAILEHAATQLRAAEHPASDGAL